MQVTAETLENRTVALQVEVEPERVDRAFERVYRQLGKYVEVPGFRPGKAPIGLLRQALREDYVRQQVLEQLLKETMTDAMKQAQVEPYGAPPELDVQQLEEGKPMLYSLKVPLEPSVELGDYRALKVTRYQPVVTEEDIDREIEARRRQNARYQRVEREARRGDVVFVSIVPYFEGESEPGETRWDMVPLDEGGTPHPLSELVLGARVGETREDTVEFPPDYTDPLLQGKRVRVQVTVRGVSELVLPSDEELLREQNLQSMDELREQVRQSLLAEMSQYAERLSRSSLRQAVLQAAKVDISPVIITSRARDSLAALNEQLRRGGYTLADYARGYNMSEAEFVEYWHQRTASDILYGLILAAIREREGIALTDEERQQALQKVAEEHGVTEQEAAESEELEEALNALLTQKTLQFLWSVADVTEEELRIQSKPEQSDNQE
ncbi:MAG: trigger factor [Armatimonadota bacterium]|nr:trigger factor [bacterium]MCS7308616.1 trigger factor [Armatimonadota bacterium]MDW8289930.1 trigger factor [Armatimonadota bacterium]